MIDIEELERLHAAALDWDGDAAAECLNALPGLIAELRALREVIAVLDRDGGHAQEASTPEQTKARTLSAIYALREVAEAAREHEEMDNPELASESAWDDAASVLGFRAAARAK
jgi:hypothetical protein